MFIISLLCHEQIKKTAIRKNPNDAVDIAQSWYQSYKEECSKDDYITIKQQTQNQEEAILFAEIRFGQPPEEARMMLRMNGDLKKNVTFTSKLKLFSKEVLIELLEFTLVKLAEYLVEKNKNRRGSV